MLVFFRVDDRLVHGQVVEGWIPAMEIQSVVVISDEMAGDELRQNMMRFATPAGIHIQIVSVNDAPEVLRKIEKNDLRTMAVMPGLDEAVKIMKAGIKIPSLNLGGTVYTACRNLFAGNAVFLKDAEKKMIFDIAEKGTKLDCRGVPTDDPIDVMEIAARK
ncbi:MAG: PTS sugar transporter subunit IIB [Elusimicrobiales bacterium]|nr:PTS sugar transporter subunit IIB [Elusimicrobiales bacterium]